VTEPLTEPVTEPVTFGVELRQSRRAAGLSLRELAVRVGYDFSYLSQVERGLRPGSEHLARRCDQALDTGASLTAAYRRSRPVPQPQPAPEAGREPMPTTVGPAAYDGPEMLEATRHGLAASFGRVPGEAEWQAVVAAYAQDVFTTSPADLLSELTADLELLRHTAAAASDRTTSALALPAARLAVVMALVLAALGRRRDARRWWRTARDTADRTGDPRTRVLVRGWEAGVGLYTQRPLPDVLALTGQALAITVEPCGAEGAGLLAARAQILARSGRDADARQTLLQLADVTAALSPGDTSLFGWPEFRLCHTESYVYTVLGDHLAAYDAQDRAFELYPPELCGEQAMVHLHRASCLVAAGELNGLGYAMRVLVELPDHCHNELLYDVAGRVLTAVRPGDLAKPVVRDYRELLLHRPHLSPTAGHRGGPGA